MGEGEGVGWMWLGEGVKIWVGILFILHPHPQFCWRNALIEKIVQSATFFKKIRIGIEFS